MKEKCNWKIICSFVHKDDAIVVEEPLPNDMEISPRKTEIWTSDITTFEYIS